MGGIILLALAVAFLVSSISYLSVSKQQRGILLSRLSLHRRRSSGASTPPRFLSQEKKDSSNSSSPDYVDTFPPSRRFILDEVRPDIAEKSKYSLNYLSQSAGCQQTPLAIDANFSTAEGTAFTPTGFSVEEVRSLGDFPDYAALSGVPLPKPYPEFDVKRAKAKPYRPLRWAYHQTMSFSKMDSDWWLELENTYVNRVKQRQDLFAKHGKRVLDSLPGSELACKELMEMCLEFLCARYPHYFRLDKCEMIFHNDILRTQSNLKQEHPLHTILNNIPEDFGITLRDDKTGYYYLRAGVICSSLGWDLGVKLGMRLDEIHQPIPDYKEKMRFSMDRYFAKKPTDKAIQRGSWGLEVDEPLYMPAGDPHEKYREVQDPSLDISRMHLRVDWQTLRRLPLSGAIVFNFKALFTPVEAFREEPYIPSLLLRILKNGKKNLMEYKNTWHTEHVVVPALEAYRKEQIQKGMIPENWDEHTLEEYPMYPRWEKRWHLEQGF
ncbi:uncharacterized protein K452DRAFT_246230 [Aplosporella prunicola CBS 121167]|uniref:Alpha-1,2-mannosyltransferase n=1 Tax=Aplosporella prunicola CBS 121167 TaxID=1176127 RepID=A0A6A6BL76_9PEZI|nr:uncharacterized protein K452DRAFT_246230 [Aplosporella prunicola CBS 121167]KAF2144075.1 hypothetical protein K452DRAFT_246230 [Aplosporella prunicola CBS 121167]